MSLMERRVQLLLDQERYDRVAAAASQENRSVSALIRDAIDVCYPEVDSRRRQAAAKFLELAYASDHETPPEPFDGEASLRDWDSKFERI